MRVRGSAGDEVGIQNVLPHEFQRTARQFALAHIVTTEDQAIERRQRQTLEGSRLGDDARGFQQTFAQAMHAVHHTGRDGAARAH